MQNRSVTACENGEWHLHLWDPACPATSQLRVPFRCRSWRHEGECRLWKGAQDFVRVAEALKSAAWWTYLVLTFKQRDWSSDFRQARAGVVCWAKLRKRMTRAFGCIPYVQTWERHRKKGFHVNLIISNRRVFQAVQSASSPEMWTWLRVNAEAAGFGYICWAETMRHNSDSLAGYLTKLSRELTGAGVKNQIPTQAPPHFRRLRASRGLLPPVHHGDWTGHLVKAPLRSYVPQSAPLQKAVIHAGVTSSV